MPKRDEAPIGAPCWVDLLTSDQDGSRVFYGELFGWTVDDPGPDYGGYINFHKDGIPVAGCMTNDGSGGPDVWGVYLATDDAEKTVAAAIANGGEVIVPAMDVMDLGKMAIVADVGHAGIGAWQPGRHRGFGLLAEPGAPSVVRAAHPRLRRVGALLPGRVQVGDERRGRHPRVPLHDARQR